MTTADINKTTPEVSTQQAQRRFRITDNNDGTYDVEMIYELAAILASLIGRTAGDSTVHDLYNLIPDVIIDDDNVAYKSTYNDRKQEQLGTIICKVGSLFVAKIQQPVIPTDTKLITISLNVEEMQLLAALIWFTPGLCELHTMAIHMAITTNEDIISLCTRLRKNKQVILSSDGIGVYQLFDLSRIKKEATNGS